MEKISKKIFVVAIIAMIVMMFNVKVNAATYDAEGYLLLEDETKNNETSEQENKTNDTTEKQDGKTETVEENKTNYANTATEPHSQAGSFENATFIVAGSILLVSVGVGYIKLKKYNF